MDVGEGSSQPQTTFSQANVGQGAAQVQECAQQAQSQVEAQAQAQTMDVGEGSSQTQTIFAQSNVGQGTIQLQAMDVGEGSSQAQTNFSQANVGQGAAQVQGMGEVRLQVDPLKKMARKFNKLSPHHCICKFEKEYSPKRIGLGLFHHTDPSNNEQEWREFKDSALTKTVGQIQDMKKTNLIKEVVSLLVSIEDCYVDSDKYSKLKDYGETKRAVAFAMDACFILQFLIDGIPDISNDINNDIIEDIFTFQNQIPLFLLFDMMKWKFGNPQTAAKEFAKALTEKRPFRFLSPLALSSGEDIRGFLEKELLDEGCHHLIHLLHKSIAHFLHVPEQFTPAGLTTPLKCYKVLESLDTYNITFEKTNEQILFTESWFWFLFLSSTLHLPQISLDGETFPVHRSLMQFGRISRNYKLICDLTCLMKCIAVEERNENLLRNKEIIQGARDDRFFKRLSDLCTGVTDWHGGVYRTVIDELDEHSKIIRNRWIYNVYKFLYRYGSFGLFLTLLFGVVGIVLKKK